MPETVGLPTSNPEREALDKCVEAFEAINDWLGQASTRQYATDAMWRAQRAIQALGIPIRMNADGANWRGSVFRALHRCGLSWTGNEDEIRFRLWGQPEWSRAGGPTLIAFLEAAWSLVDMARSLMLEYPGNYYWLEQPLSKILAVREGMPARAIICAHCGRDKE